MSAPAALADAIDLDRYPIDDLDGPAARTLVGRCREQLGSVGACELEGFLRADAVADAVRSVHELRSLAFRTETTPNLEFSGREADLEADDPLRIQVRSRRCSPTTRSRATRRCAPSTSPTCSRASSGPRSRSSRIDRQADEIGALSVMFYGEGDELGRRVDDADFVVTLMLQPSISGGAFEYMPMLGSADDPNPDGVRPLLTGDRAGERELSPAPARSRCSVGV